MEHREYIDEWQQIEQQRQSPETSGWNMVVIDENYLEAQVQDDIGDQSSSSSTSTYNPPSPTHHQDSLQIIPTTTDPEDGTSSPSSVTDEEDVPAAPPSDWRVRVAKKVLKLRLEAMRSRVHGMASKVSNWVMCTGAFWSITYVTGVAAAAAVLASLVYAGIRWRRRRVDGQSVDHWIDVLREKDEKISQLLCQIAQLNEMLSSRRKVLVHRIND